MERVVTQSCISNNSEFFRISLLLKILKSSFLKWLWTLPVIIIIFFNCQQPHPPETLLQVGAIQVNAEKLTRYLKNFRQKQNLKTWIDYYRSYPMVRIIENRAMLHEHLEQFVFEQSAYHHAQKMGLLKDEKLLRFLDFYQQKQMVEIYLREKAAAEIQITEAEMQAEYENHPEKYRTEPIAGISTIEFLTHAAALAIIDSCRKNPEQFAELKQHYERQMQTQKEIVRFFTPSNIPYAPDSQVAFQLKIDSITAPIKIPKQKAYLLIKKMSHIPSKTLSFTAASAEIRKNLVAERLPVFRAQWEKELREKYKISINQQLISKYFKKPGRYLNY